jgi:putative transposase
MAEGHRMTAADLVDKLLADEHADVLRDSVAWLVTQLMEAEVGGLTGAGLGERAPDRRQAQRNGYRPRRWDTRVGELELAIPKLRTGSYFPSFLEPRRRAEQALVAVVQEAYVNGISTRKVDRLVEQLGLQEMSKDTVSRLCRGLDEQVTVFRERPLEGAYPYLWLDAKVERVREAGGVRHKALVIAYGVHATGRREVVGIDVGEAETEAFWRSFLRSLRARGLDGVQLVISDAHTGLVTAIAKVLGCRWQRCTVHFLRDMLGHVARAQQPLVSGAIRGIFTAGSAVEARQRLGQVADQLRPHAPRSPGCWRTPRLTCWRSMGSRPSTGPSCAPPIRWSGSTARSAAARMWWGSSRTTPPCSGWPGCCCWSRTTSGWSAAATCRRPPWPWSSPTPPLNPTTPTPRRSPSSPHHDG